MKEHLITIDAVLRLALGLALALAPKATALVLGLPKVGETFWPRMLGVVLVGLGAAMAVDVVYKGAYGLGLGGAFAINVATAFGLATGLVVGGLETRRYGRIALWAAVGLLTVLSLLELAWV
jgi:uncharacterized membrane protein